jgi:hypothetical protein
MQVIIGLLRLLLNRYNKPDQSHTFRHYSYTVVHIDPEQLRPVQPVSLPPCVRIVSALRRPWDQAPLMRRQLSSTNKQV